MFHQWGGPSSTDRAEALMEEVLGMFQGVDKIYKDVSCNSSYDQTPKLIAFSTHLIFQLI